MTLSIDITQHAINSIKSMLGSDKTRNSGKWMYGLKCPQCGEFEAYVNTEKPFYINCSRNKKCGYSTKITDAIPEFSFNIESEYKPLKKEPNRPATQFLKLRGLNKSLENLNYSYWDKTRPGCKGAVMFQIDKNTWNGRLISPNGSDKSHNKGPITGKYWKHSGLKYDKEKPVYITEAIIDSLSLIEEDRQSVSVLSSNAAPENYNISDLGTVILAFDNDLAGLKATLRWMEYYQGIKAILPPKGRDWNDLLNRRKNERIDKYFNQFYTKDQIENFIKQAESNKEISNWFDQLNKEHAIVMAGGKCRVLNEIINDGQPDFTLSAVYDFHNYYANAKVPIYRVKTDGSLEEKEEKISHLWFESKNRRQYKSIIFDPQNTDTDYYNLWRGFAIKEKEGDWSKFKNHIENIICNGDDDLYRWIVSWMAWIVQNPGRIDRPGASIVLRSENGTGKDTFANLYGRIFGNHYKPISNRRHMVGNFNNHLKDALVVFCNEAFFAGDKSSIGVLKSMVTDPKFIWESKGVDAILFPNRLNIIMASNLDFVVPADTKERRFCVIDVSPEILAWPKSKKRDYFTAIYKQMEKDGGLEAMLYDLLRWDYSKVDLRSIPKTEALLDQILETMNSVQKYWFECLQSDIGPGDRHWDDINIDSWMSSNQLYDHYVKFVETSLNKWEKKELNSVFFKIINDLCPKISKTRPLMGGKRTTGYHIPNIAECRKSFIEKLDNIGINWDSGLLDGNGKPDWMNK
jgi:hypothetical protein